MWGVWGRSPPTSACAARILGCVVDLHCRRQAGHGDGWVGGVLLKVFYVLTCRILGLIVVLFRGDQATVAEVLVLRQENAVLRRHAGRVRYEPADRAWLAALARIVSRRRWSEVFPVTPATLLAWQAGSEKVRPERAAQARPPSHNPRDQATGAAPGAGESAVGPPPDPGRAAQARYRRGAIYRLGDPARRRHRSRTPPLGARPGGSSCTPRPPGSSPSISCTQTLSC